MTTEPILFKVHCRVGGLANDLSIYEVYANEWWQDDSHYFKSLRNTTPVRLSLIKDWIGDLRHKRVLDLGCGGGLVTVPLINAGAEVTGVDISPASIEVARTASGFRGKFLCADIRRVSFEQQSFDFVVLAEVLDHLREYRQVMEQAAASLKRGGKMFISTLNRNMLSRFLTVTCGEGLGLIPKGTHDWRLFIKPKELLGCASAAGLRLHSIQGELPLIYRSLRDGVISLRRSRLTWVAYSMLLEKN